MNDEWMNGNLVTLIMYVFHQMMEFMGGFPTLFIFKSWKPHTNFLTPFEIQYKYIQTPAMFQKKFHHLES